MSTGEVLGIYITSSPGSPLHAVPAAKAVPGRGIEGDRFFDRTGALVKAGKPVPPAMELSLIECEAIEALAREEGIQVDHAASRRNIVTRGVALNHLVGKTFRVGSIKVTGIKLCEPCGHLESLTQIGIRSGLVHRGGLRCKILTDGTIKVGDPIDMDVPIARALSDSGI